MQKNRDRKKVHDEILRRVQELLVIPEQEEGEKQQNQREEIIMNSDDEFLPVLFGKRELFYLVNGSMNKLHHNSLLRDYTLRWRV